MNALISNEGKNHTMKQRNSWLLLASPFLVVALIYGASWLRDANIDPSSVTSTLSPIPTRTARERAALLRLSQDLKTHPKANTFLVKEAGSPNGFDFIVKYVRKGKDNEVILGPNNGIFAYTYTKAGKKYAMYSSPFPEKAIHETAKVQGDLKSLHQIVGPLIVIPKRPR
jgi:hypothetical protein